MVFLCKIGDTFSSSQRLSSQDLTIPRAYSIFDSETHAFLTAGGFLSHGGTPSYHPCHFPILHQKTLQLLRYPPFMERRWAVGTRLPEFLMDSVQVGFSWVEYADLWPNHICHLVI
jgi:hypothetical protein